jgi:hypothetical protein
MQVIDGFPSFIQTLPFGPIFFMIFSDLIRNVLIYNSTFGFRHSCAEGAASGWFAPCQQQILVSLRRSEGAAPRTV